MATQETSSAVARWNDAIRAETERLTKAGLRAEAAVQQARANVARRFPELRAEVVREANERAGRGVATKPAASADTDREAIKAWGDAVTAERDTLIAAGWERAVAFQEARRRAVHKYPELHSAMLRAVNSDRPAALRQAGLA